MLWLLLPLAVLVFLRKQNGLPKFILKLIAPARVYRILIPIGLISICCFYALYQGGITGPRAYTSDDLYSALLIPITVNEGPTYDRYGLFSVAHFLTCSCSHLLGPGI